MYIDRHIKGCIFHCISVFNAKSIDANTTTELLDKPLVVQESEVLKVTAGDANELHVIASIMEVKP